MDWLDLLAVQGTLMSLLQHHSSKASILWHSAFFVVQLSLPYESSPTLQFKASIVWCPGCFMVQLSHQDLTTGKL